jgi:hypothetical protein
MFPDEHCRELCGVIHRFKPNHLGRRSVQLGKLKEIPVGSHYRVAMPLCEIMDDFVARFALKAELPHVGALK